MPITRETLFSVLYNLLALVGKCPEMGEERAEEILGAFTDNGDIDSCARIPTAVMVDMGVVQGMPEGLKPFSAATRAQAAVLVGGWFEA